MTPTKDELYAEAERLDVEGRSSMSKAELAAAIRDAGGDVPDDDAAEPRVPPQDSKLLGQDVGYVGVKVDPRPNSDYSLESGPASPTAADSRADLRSAAEEGDES